MYPKTATLSGARYMHWIDFFMFWMCNVILWNNNLNLRVTIQGHCGSQCCVDVSYKISTSKEDAASTQDKNKRTAGICLYVLWIF